MNGHPGDAELVGRNESGQKFNAPGFAPRRAIHQEMIQC